MTRLRRALHRLHDAIFTKKAATTLVVTAAFLKVLLVSLQLFLLFPGLS